MMIKSTLAGLGLVLAITSAAEAVDPRSIDRTQAWQQHQIEQNRRNGQLTRREQADLLAEQARIAEMERRALRDGHLSRREAALIREAQRDAQRHIDAETHDREVNIGRRWKWRHGF
jgi:hypothetical protein